MRFIGSGFRLELRGICLLCLYFMGLNVSNEQIAHELSINESDAYQMTTELRGGIVKKSQP